MIKKYTFGDVEISFTQDYWIPADIGEEMYEMLDALLKYNIPRTSLEAMQIRKLLAKARGEGEV